MPKVRMPTGEVVDMPDNPTPQQIADLAAIQSPQPEAPQPSFGRALGLTARDAITGLTGSAGMVGDALNTAINMGGRAMGHDPQLGMPSQAIQGLMTKAGLPEPQTTTEKIVSMLASTMAGSKDPLMNAATSRYLPPTAKPELTPRESAISEGQALGYKVPPSEAMGGTIGTQLERLSGKEPLYNNMALANQTVTDKVARQVVGLPPGSYITEEAIDAAKKATYAAGYEPIKQVGTITTGKVYRQSLDKVLNDFQGAPGSFPLAAKNDVKDLVNAYRVRSFDSEHAIDAIQSLRSDATLNFRGGNPNLGKAQQAVAKALEDNIELNLQGMGQNGSKMLAEFRASRVQLAKQNVVAKALEKGTGEVNAQKIAGQLKRNGENYLTGDLATIGNFAANAQKVTKVPQMQSVPIYRHPITTAAGAGLTSLIPGGQLPAAVIAGFPLGQAGLRQAMMTPMAQRMLGPQLDPNILARLAGNPSVINAMPTGIGQTGLFGPR